MVNRLFAAPRLHVFVLTVLTVATTARADVIFDQNGGGPNFVAQVSSTSAYQQEVTAGVTGTFEGVELWSWGAAPRTNPIVVGINLGTGWQTDAADLSRTFAPTDVNRRMYIDFSSTPLFMNAGDSFVITLDGIAGGGIGAVAFGNNDYAGHSFFQNSVALPDFDLTFSTYMNAVPEPSATMLLAIGGMATIGARRKRRD